MLHSVCVESHEGATGERFPAMQAACRPPKGECHNFDEEHWTIWYQVAPFCGTFPQGGGLDIHPPYKLPAGLTPSKTTQLTP